MTTARWHDAEIARSDATVLVERNHYFPADSVDAALLEDSATRTICPWKGEAHYKDAGRRRRAQSRCRLVLSRSQAGRGGD